ncbi:MAG: hypothetical protein R2792_07085 [Saprospiraceae bacterium]
MTDLLRIDTDGKRSIRISQWTTLGVGAVSLVLATAMTSVLDLMLMSYAFMVAGLLVPVLAMLFTKDAHPEAAFWSMLTGGGSTILLTILQTPIPFGFDPILVGIILSGLVYVVIHWRMVKHNSIKIKQTVLAAIELNASALAHNFNYLKTRMQRYKKDWGVVTKLLCGNELYLSELARLGPTEVHDSRLSNLEKLKKSHRIFSGCISNRHPCEVSSDWLPARMSVSIPTSKPSRPSTKKRSVRALFIKSSS